MQIRLFTCSHFGCSALDVVDISIGDDPSEDYDDNGICQCLPIRRWFSRRELQGNIYLHTLIYVYLSRHDLLEEFRLLILMLILLT